MVFYVVLLSISILAYNVCNRMNIVNIQSYNMLELNYKSQLLCGVTVKGVTGCSGVTGHIHKKLRFASQQIVYFSQGQSCNSAVSP